MFGSISRFLFGDSQVSDEATLVTVPDPLAAINEDLDFDSKSEDGEWVLISKDEPSAAMTLSTSQMIESPPVDQSTAQPIIITVVARPSKKSKKKKKKAAKELRKSSGERKANLASKILPGVLTYDRYLSAKTSESKAFRCGKKSLERNNKAIMVASCQRKPHMSNVSLRYNISKGNY